MKERLSVYLNDRIVGSIERNPRSLSKIRFTLDDSYAGPASALSEGFALVQWSSPDDEQISNFLGGYLPEGQNRIALANKAGVDQSDLFGLLRRYGLTMAGALSIRTDEATDNIEPGYRELSDRDLVKKIKKAVKESDLGNEPDSGRSTITGFQAKLLLARFDGQWYQPLRRAHSTHIIKPAPAHRPELIADEYYSHQLSRHMGLSTFDSELLEISGTKFLAIERYDRTVNADKSITLHHQEDAAQALGLDWVNSISKFQDVKFPQRRGRPSARAIAEIFGSLGDGTDLEKWLSHLLFSVLVGNHDAHAKNTSIVHRQDGSRISDLYDAVPLVHINDDPERANSAKISDELSLGINGKFNHHAISKDDLHAEARSWGALPDRRISVVINDTLQRFSDALSAVAKVPGYSPNLTDRLGYNVDRISSGKSIGKPKMPLANWNR